MKYLITKTLALLSILFLFSCSKNVLENLNKDFQEKEFIEDNIGDLFNKITSDF